MTTRLLLVRSILAHARGTAHRSIPAVLTVSGLIVACGIEYPTAPGGAAGSPNSRPGLMPGGSPGTGGGAPAGTGGVVNGAGPSVMGKGGGAPVGTGGGAPSGPPAGGSGGATIPPPDSNNCDMIKAESRAILQNNCAGCHEAPNKQGTLDFILEVDKLKSSGLLVPGSPETSRIYSRIAAGEMPPQGQTQRPSNGDQTTLYQWIKVCTLASPAPVADAGGGSGGPGGGSGGAGGGTGMAAAPFIDNQMIARWMAADITSIRLDDQRFQRYLSLAHLQNAGATSDEMDLYRYALVKAINALSEGTQIITPRAIDPYQTVYRIDLRDLEWDASGTRADKWEVLVNGDPYAIEFVDDASTVVKQLSRTRVPMQSGNWLVYGGMQPPLYNALVDIPATLNDLQRQLGTNIAQDIAREDVWRSGFSNSGIAQLNRVIERHEIPAGGSRVMWVSYDFAGNGGKENIFANPLDFESDASEIIFSLPNGMHGYMLVDGAGNRLDEGSDKVVVDRSQRDGNVINGISCIGCHDGGIKFKRDELRPYVDQSFNFDARTKDIVDVIYSAPDTFQTLVAGDSSVFLQQIQKLSPPPTVTAEPVSSVFHKFDEDVDLKHAAAELGVSSEQLLTQLGRLDPGLAPLVSGKVKREVFRASFAQTVCLLKVGIARDAACGTGGSTVTGTGGSTL